MVPARQVVINVNATGSGGGTPPPGGSGGTNNGPTGSTNTAGSAQNQNASQSQQTASWFTRDNVGRGAAAINGLVNWRWVKWFGALFVVAWWLALQIPQVRIIHWGWLSIPIVWSPNYDGKRNGNEKSERSLQYDYDQRLQQCTDNYISNHDRPAFDKCVTQVDGDLKHGLTAIQSTSGGPSSLVSSTATAPAAPVIPTSGFIYPNHDMKPVDKLDTPLSNVVRQGNQTEVWVSPREFGIEEGNFSVGDEIEITATLGIVKLDPADIFYVSPRGGPKPKELPTSAAPEEYMFSTAPIGALVLDNSGDLVHIDRPGIKITLQGNTLKWMINIRTVPHKNPPTGVFVVRYVKL